MASEKRQPDTALKDRLFKEYYNFSFFKAVDLLEALYPQKEKLGQTLEPGKEAVRFSVKPGLAFPPSEIAKLEVNDNRARPVSMEVAFMGLIGPSGVLPQWYNELAIKRNWKKDFGLVSFLNMFHHRLISLFYLAWKKHRFTENYLPEAEDRHSRYLLCLEGLGFPGLTEMIGLPRESLAFYSGLLSRSVPSAVAIEATVQYFSTTDVNIEQFIEREIAISREDLTRLGTANIQLGVDTICGSFIRECQTKFRVNLGPMGYDKFLRFLPTGDLLGRIFALIRYMVGIEYEFEIRVFLKRTELPPCILGLETPAAPRLGWSTWLKSADVTHEEDPYITFEEQDR
jgi:type VI secretion system protein ImpH